VKAQELAAKQAELEAEQAAREEQVQRAEEAEARAMELEARIASLEEELAQAVQDKEVLEKELAELQATLDAELSKASDLLMRLEQFKTAYEDAGEKLEEAQVREQQARHEKWLLEGELKQAAARAAQLDSALDERALRLQEAEVRLSTVRGSMQAAAAAIALNVKEMRMEEAARAFVQTAKSTAAVQKAKLQGVAVNLKASSGIMAANLAENARTTASVQTSKLKEVATALMQKAQQKGTALMQKAQQAKQKLSERQSQDQP